MSDRRLGRHEEVGPKPTRSVFEEDASIMTRMTLFNSPHMLGFDHFERVLDRIAKTSGEGYPPYNIEQTSETGLRITLAVAGFTMDCLQVSVEDNQLIIRGRNAEEDPNRIYLHRGIAARQFQRAFVLAEGIEVKNATMDNGLLHIDLQRPLPETRVRTVKIEQSAGNTIDGNALGVSKGK